MVTELPPLPYAKDALEPYLTAKTLDAHYEKHHRGYLQKLLKLLEGTAAQDRELVELVRTSSGEIFNNAAQVWNHTFYWESMFPSGGARPRGRIGEVITREFGSFEAFRETFVSCATQLFGSGYVWLSFDPANEKIGLERLKDADTPLRKHRVPLLCMDVWEHAYYLDYQNRRDRYARDFADHLACWEFAEANLEKALG